MNDIQTLSDDDFDHISGGVNWGYAGEAALYGIVGAAAVAAAPFIAGSAIGAGAAAGFAVGGASLVAGATWLRQMAE
ncbi:hypothetical protein [Asaia bogorensis]|uniref:hypothetical protein n=1 Tax=Asaia bogorensis TaxID=91915 RepID=UPI000EFB9518|nr:hypothetical protein [Asaia bogorensis]